MVERSKLSSYSIESALLLHDYTYAIDNSQRNIDKLLDSKPSYHEVIKIMSIQDLPHEHRRKLQEYNNLMLEKELELFTEKQEKIPLMRSEITVVGRGRDGKTSTINSLKGLPFQTYCESTKGAKTSEVDVHEVGMHVTNVDASGSNEVAFQEAERDSLSTKRSVSSHLWKSSIEREFDNESIKNEDKKGSSDIDLNPTVSNNDSSDDNAPPLKRSKIDLVSQKEEDDIIQIIDNIDLSSSKDGKSVRFTIYDNGGQKVFRSIQNLLLSREGIFIVVFDMMKICNESSREEALEHLHYWLSSIKMDACDTSDESTDPSIKYPPVILVGTHYDEFLKLKGDPSKGLEALNKTLINNLPLSDLVPLSCLSNDLLPRDRQQLYNEKQDLCFWPVNNSNPSDANIQAIRRILLDAAINDPGFDIAQEVPISFLRAMDRLTTISEEVPILPIDSNDPEESSVMNVMHECGVFEDGLNEGQKKLEICKAILKKYQSIGHFIYFDQEGLEDYCILDPQWLINMITYIVRDFKLHRFRRDFNAMALNGGEPWKALLNRGLLHGALLRKLWLDREHELFLTELMLELGIFGQLNCSSKDLIENNVYTVPTAITISTQEAMTLSIPKVEEHLCIESLDTAVKELIDMSRCSFNLVSFYSRLVNRLISEWRNGYDIEKNPPQLLSCAANLCLSPDYTFSIIINEKDAALEVYCNDSDKMDIVWNYVYEECIFVNTKYFRKQLQVKINHREAKRAVYRDIKTGKQKTFDSYDENTESIPVHPNLQALLNFLINAKLARIIHEEDEEMTPNELVELYYDNEETFENEILPKELGITKHTDKHRIIKILKQQPKPPEPLQATHYAVLNFHDDNELVVKEEENGIVKRLRTSLLTSTVIRGQSFTEIHRELTRNQDYKVVHFASHGSSINSSIACKMVTCLKDTSVKFAFFNTCNSKQVADLLYDEALIERILYWESTVEDNTARTFSEAIYEYLSMNRRQNYLDFEGAYNFAKKHLKLRNYRFIDPHADDKDLERMKREFATPDLVAAGIPKLLDRSRSNTTTSKKRRRNGDFDMSDANVLKCDEDQQELSVPLYEEEEEDEEPNEPKTTICKSTQASPNADAVPVDSTAIASIRNTNQSNSTEQSGGMESDAERTFTDGHRSTCKLMVNYKFTCGHSIISNCQFIKYENHSMQNIYKRDAARSSSRCNSSSCQKHFCTGKDKIPSDGNFKNFKSCFEKHKCEINRKSLKYDCEVPIPKSCKEYSLWDPKKKETKPKNTEFTHCAKCQLSNNETSTGASGNPNLSTTQGNDGSDYNQGNHDNLGNQGAASITTEPNPLDNDLDSTDLDYLLNT